MTELIYTCKVLKTRGLKGQVKVETEDERENRFKKGLSLHTEEGDILTLSSFKQEGRISYLNFSEITDIDQAEKLRGKKLYVDEKDLGESPEGFYYIKDLIGSSVYEGDKLIGQLVQVRTSAAQDIFEIETTDNQMLLIPAVKEFILSINEDEKIISVKLIEGMLEEAEPDRAGKTNERSLEDSKKEVENEG